MDTNNKTLQVISGIAVVAIVALVVYFNYFKKSEVQNTNQPATTTEDVVTKDVQYKNTEYGFTFSLPDSWKNYSVVKTEWQGDSMSMQGQVYAGTIVGPLVSIRHPGWTSGSPRQDIPVMVFTVAQWNDMQADKFHVGAAPINPSELGRNAKYVFAIPARYNFSYLTGYEEVDKIIQNKTNFQTF